MKEGRKKRTEDRRQKDEEEEGEREMAHTKTRLEKKTRLTPSPASQWSPITKIPV